MERFPLSAVNVSKLMYIYFQCGSQLDSRLESALSKFSFLTLTTAGTSSDDAITLNCESGMQVENAANIVATNIFYTTTSLCFNNSIDAEIRPRPFLPAHQCFFSVNVLVEIGVAGVSHEAFFHTVFWVSTTLHLV